MTWIQAEGCLTEIVSRSPEETEAIGERLAGRLKSGSVVALRGKLGAGKTCLAKGIARALGVTETVTSPTYTIVSEYRGTLPLYHIDAYRLGGDDDFANIGGDELLDGNGVSLVEWSERIPRSLPADAIIIQIEISGPQERIVKITEGTDEHTCR
jgi:tRNA threonylcarbamoyladenosine biosynthesis protein TsaE